MPNYIGDLSHPFNFGQNAHPTTMMDIMNQGMNPAPQQQAMPGMQGGPMYQPPGNQQYQSFTQPWGGQQPGTVGLGFAPLPQQPGPGAGTSQLPPVPGMWTPDTPQQSQTFWDYMKNVDPSYYNQFAPSGTTKPGTGTAQPQQSPTTYQQNPMGPFSNYDTSFAAPQNQQYSYQAQQPVNYASPFSADFINPQNSQFVNPFGA